MGKAPVYDLSSSKDAQTCAIRHIGIGTYSSGKIREYLIHKGFERSTVDEAITSLIDREYVDDIRAGNKVLRARSGTRQESRYYLKQRLRAAGVSDEAAEQILSGVEEDSDLCFNLFLNVRNPYGLTGDPEAFREELLKAALKRGFSSETAGRAFDRWYKKVTDNNG